MRQNCFIGIDVGSASVRAGVFTSAGQRLAFAVRPISQFHPRSNVVEQSSQEIWQAVCDTVREATGLAEVQPQDIQGIGFDATCSLVVVGENGRAISVAEQGEPERDIIMWMDHRATREAADINATGDEALQFVGGEVSVEMELPKVLWLKRHFPQRYQQAWRLFDLADYLVWRATGADVASVCTLACKWNYLSHQSRFSQPLLDAIGLSDLPTRVPGTVLPPGTKAGCLSAQAAAAFGLPPEIVVASGIIDAHAGGLALVGSQPEGNLALIGGTSNCHMLVSREPLMVPGVWGPYWGAMLPDWWLNEGGQSAAGSLVEWTLRQNEAWPELQALAQQRGENIYSILNGWVASLEQRESWPTAQLHVLADHHGNRSPRANPLARGAITGLTLEHGQDALARLYLATLQAIAYGTRHIIDAMTAAGHRIDSITACGGVTKNPLWLREYANITGRDIHLCSEEDAVTLGAALMGAVASGYYADLPQAAGAMVRPGEIVRADPNTADFHQAKYQLYLQMYQQQQHAADLMQTWINS
ncbi:FGGY-family carbohydrate kinase [Klebsiella pneumoniae]|uniref:FGGY-family carbohydrate kinase n=1 Tax=Klebsiella pneumoniae TaxID=573 RepID=UPI0015E996EB|nr:FGGY-family carbohydrate kinase [Klebsiella pneumoniae]QLS82874.1 FGGY-family carbohydrate kinase [Klebsiella pneumoniae]HBS7612478.1 FGGY-family carbohydrate kinase [Klebsiella pneumoniae]